MPNNNDLKKLMEARREGRRAIPQVDPADVVAGGQQAPEAVVTEPKEPTQVVEDKPFTVNVEPDFVAVHPAPEKQDARYLPAPTDDVYVAKTYRLKRHRHQQLKDEAYHRDMQIQDIIDIALGEYFEKRYGTPK